MTSNLSIEDILAEGGLEEKRLVWEGTFADYLRMAVEDPSVSRLSHSLVYDAIMAEGVEFSPDGEPVYGLFRGEIFGLEERLDRIVQYFAASAQRLEVRKRILLMLGPPASGKSSVVDLIKAALERYTRTDAGAVYAIQGCPMQEDPLHLVPEKLRAGLFEQYGVYVEGSLCPRCRYVLRTEYDGEVSEMAVARVTFDEKAAVGIGYYIANNPNPTDASFLVGSVDMDQLGGDRREVLGKAFRLDGELNIANRGIMEFVEMFKADRNMLTTLLGLAQEQLIKLQRFGSVYADEVIVGHSNEGDFDTFAAEQHAEALKDRIISVQVPYALKASEEVKIYEKMLTSGTVQDVHMAPLTLTVAAIFTVLSRIEPPDRQGMSIMQKLRLYDRQTVGNYTRQDLRDIQRHHPNEGMHGISPRYVMNRLGTVASEQATTCVTPLAALDSLWLGLGENISLADQQNVDRYVGFVNETVKEYNDLAVREIQKAFEEGFEGKAATLLEGYVRSVAAYADGEPVAPRAKGDATSVSERDMREIERAVGVKETDKRAFRLEVTELVESWRSMGREFKYTSDPRLRAAIESRLFQSRRKVERALTEPRFARQKVEWEQRQSSIMARLKDSYGYCDQCAADLLAYVSHVLKNRAVHKTPRNEGVEWLWQLNPGSSEPVQGPEAEPEAVPQDP